MTTLESRYLFVYGTLLSRFDNPFATILHQHSRKIGSGTFQGRLYLIDDYPGAVASLEPQDQIHGEVVEMFQPAALLAQLDHYEGYDYAVAVDSHEFIRRVEWITLKNGQRLQAYIYLYNRSTDALTQIDNGCYEQISQRPLNYTRPPSTL